MNNTLIDQGVTKECAGYCMRSIVRLMDGDTNKFEEYALKALEINKKDKNEIHWTSCKFRIDGKLINARINMLTQEIRDLEGNVLRAGVER